MSLGEPNLKNSLPGGFTDQWPSFLYVILLENTSVDLAYTFIISNMIWERGGNHVFELILQEFHNILKVVFQ